MVISFLECKPSMLMQFNASNEGLAFPTPRSWEMVSNILNHVSDDVEKVFPLISGCIGEEAAYELRCWRELYDTAPEVESIFEGKTKSIPVRPEILFVLSSQLIHHANENHSDEEISNLIYYAAKMPIEFRNRIFTDLLHIKSIRKKLSRISVYDDWFLRTGRDWEDYGVI
jgi:hypothetical protein